MKNGFTTVINVVQGDYGYSLVFNLQDSAGAAVDLTNAASVRFNAQLQSNDAVQFNSAMVVTSASTGACEYVVRSTDFVVPGTWNAQVIVNYAGEVVTFTGIQVVAASALPVSNY